MSSGPGKAFAGGSEAALPRGARAPRWSDEAEPRAALRLLQPVVPPPGLAPVLAAAPRPEAPLWGDTWGEPPVTQKQMSDLLRWQSSTVAFSVPIS